MKRTQIRIGVSYAIKGNHHSVPLRECKILGPAIQSAEPAKNGGKRFVWRFPAEITGNPMRHEQIESRQLVSTWENKKADDDVREKADEAIALVRRNWDVLDKKLAEHDVYSTTAVHWNRSHNCSDRLEKKVRGCEAFYLSFRQAELLLTTIQGVD